MMGTADLSRLHSHWSHWLVVELINFLAINGSVFVDVYAQFLQRFL
jgi:hypothetical protein